MNVYRVTKTAQEYHEMSQNKSQDVEDSFDRCDTDGFLSQWASGQMSRVYNALADLAENGGKATFKYLADLDGNFINAKVINGRYGSVWMLLDDDGKATGEFAPWNTRPSTLAKRGYKEVDVERPAVIAVEGSGYQLNVFFYPEEWLS